MTFFLLAVAIMAASILFLHRIAIFFDCPIKYKPLILCAVMAFLVNFATLNISSFLTATHYAIILIFVLAASLGVTFYNARLLKKERLAASADIRGEPEAEETNETDADKTTTDEVDTAEATAEADAGDASATEATESTAKEDTDDAGATEATVEEDANEAEATEPSTEEAADEAEATEPTAEEVADEAEATEPTDEEAADDAEAAEATAEEAVDDASATAATAEKDTDDAEAAEATAEEAADDAETAEATAEEAVDDAGATAATAEKDTDDAEAAEATAEEAVDDAEEDADDAEATEPTAEEVTDDAVDEEDLDLEPAILPSEEERQRAKDELKELTEAVGRLHSMDDYLDYADRESREHHPRRAVFAYKQALGIYWNDDYAPFIAINLGNTYKEMGDYEAASETYEAALTLPATQKSVAMQQEFHRSVGYLRTVQHILASHGIAHTPFAQIPPEISAEIESAAQEA